MQHKEMLKPDEESLSVHVFDQESASSSLPITPTPDGFSTVPPTARSASATPNEGITTTEEVLRLKLELAQAKTKITRLDQELAQTRDIQFGSRRPSPTVSPDQNIPLVPNVEQITARAPGGPATNGPPRIQFPRENFWQPPGPDDCHSETSDASLSATGFNRSRAIWNTSKPAFQNSFVPHSTVVPDAPQPVPWGGLRNPDFMDQNSPFPPQGIDAFRGDHISPEQDFMMRPPSARRGNRFDHRYGQPQHFGNGFGGYNNHYDPPSAFPAGGPGVMSGDTGMGMGMYPTYPQQAPRTGLSPHAREFTSAATSSWKNDVSLVRSYFEMSIYALQLITSTVNRQSQQRVRHIYQRQSH